MPGKPTLILVPGSWHGPATWNKVVSIMEALQYKCVAVALPSTGTDPSATLLGDIEAVRGAIVAETTQGNDVVVVVHSYGGMVGSSAVKGLTRNGEDVSDNRSGHVVGIAMMATGFIPTGVSFMGNFEGKPPPIWRADLESGYLILTIDPRELFYHDLPTEEADYWVGKLGNQSLKALMEGGEHAYAGWQDVPVWYLATTDDRAIPIHAQRAMVKMVQDSGANVTLREVESSHSPMLSKPKETADFLVEALKAFEG